MTDISILSIFGILSNFQSTECSYSSWNKARIEILWRKNLPKDLYNKFQKAIEAFFFLV